MVEELRPAVPEAALADESRRQKKDAKRLAESTRSLDAWERYRTLVDALEEALDLVELADRKARFALLIMGALNVAFFFLVTRSELVEVLPAWLRPFLAFYLLAYAGVALFFFLQAIEALKPRRFRPQIAYPGAAGPDHYPDGLRYYEDVVLRDLESYRRAWRDVRFGQLNAELAVQNHVMARINSDKFRSLRRLYGGLRVLTLLAGGLLAVLALSLLLSPAPSAGPQRHADAAATGAAGAAAGSAPSGPASAPPTSLGPPVPIPAEGLKEASGIAWHSERRRFFAVGDRGTLAELDAERPRAAAAPRQGQPRGRGGPRAERPARAARGEEGRARGVGSSSTAEETARFPLDVAALLDKPPADRNQGFEGLGFREEPALPGGGTFYLVHQRKPARLVALCFDPTGPVRAIGAADVVARHSLKPYEDLTAVVWSEPLGGLLVIAESADRLLLVSPAGSLRASFGLPGDRQEGLAFDPEGALWIADDRRGLLKIPGALAVLEHGSEVGS